jgi:hypothetical protein
MIFSLSRVFQICSGENDWGPPEELNPDEPILEYDGDISKFILSHPLNDNARLRDFRNLYIYFLRILPHDLRNYYETRFNLLYLREKQGFIVGDDVYFLLKYITLLFQELYDANLINSVSCIERCTKSTNRKLDNLYKDVV